MEIFIHGISVAFLLSLIMNYLGHAYLSFGDGDILSGNLIGDFVKGRDILSAYPESIRKGILLHRAIDSFTDEHMAINDLKSLFRHRYGLYAGAIVDTLLDYCIANDPEYFPEASDLEVFSLQILQQLEDRKNYFPDKFFPYFASMKQHNWFVNYRSYEGIRQSLRGLQKRSGHMEDTTEAYTIFREKENTFLKSYKLFIKDIIPFVKKGII